MNFDKVKSCFGARRYLFPSELLPTLGVILRLKLKSFRFRIGDTYWDGNSRSPKKFPILIVGVKYIGIAPLNIKRALLNTKKGQQNSSS